MSAVTRRTLVAGIAAAMVTTARGQTPMSLESEYDNRSMVPEHPEIIARWRREAEAFRNSAAGELNTPYGARPRNLYDLFSGNDTGPLAVFIHGGYWRSFDHKVFSHCAKAFVGNGLDVVLPTYTLTPEITVPDIIDEVRQFIVHIWNRFKRPLVVTGHSAGGHLAACMVATNWTNYGIPADVIQAGMAISGLYDLRPLLATSVNNDIHLDAAQAAIASPLLWRLHRNVRFDIWVGGSESLEFIRQSRSLAAAWQGLGSDCPYVELAGINHFTVVEPLADSGSAMARRIVELAAT